jgi:hypothetical protein
LNEFQNLVCAAGPNFRCKTLMMLIELPEFTVKVLPSEGSKYINYYWFWTTEGVGEISAIPLYK